MRNYGDLDVPMCNATFDENNNRLTRCTRCANSRHNCDPVSAYIPHAFPTLGLWLIGFQVPRGAYAILNEIIRARNVVLAWRGSDTEMPDGIPTSEDLAKHVREIDLKMTSLARVASRIGLSKKPTQTEIAMATLRATERIACAVEGLLDVYRSQVF